MLDNDLVIANSKCIHQEIYKYTQVGVRRGEKCIIDYFIVGTNKWRVVKWHKSNKTSGDRKWSLFIQNGIKRKK